MCFMNMNPRSMFQPNFYTSMAKYKGINKMVIVTVADSDKANETILFSTSITAAIFLDTWNK